MSDIEYSTGSGEPTEGTIRRDLIAKELIETTAKRKMIKCFISLNCTLISIMNYEEKILSVLRGTKALSIGEISRKTGVPIPTVKKLLKKLVATGEVIVR